MLSTELIDTKFDYKLGLGFNLSSLSSYYDNQGTPRSEKSLYRTYTISEKDFDTTFIVLGDLKFEYTEFHNNYYSEFKLADKLIGGLALDLAYFSLNAKFSFNDTLRDENGEFIKNKFGDIVSKKESYDDDKLSLFRFMYLSPFLKYYIMNDKTNKLRAEIEAQIPFSFDERTKLDDGVFFDDGYMQLDIGLNYKWQMETSQLELGGGYIFRNEIYDNMYRANIGIYFTKVENAHFFIKANYYQSIGNKNKTEFIATKFPIDNTILNTSFGLNVFFEPYELQLDYTYVPYGKNVWVMNKLNVNFHYFL